MKKTRISRKMLKTYIDHISEKAKWDPGHGGGEVNVYQSKVNGSYLGMEGLENDFKWMLRKGITEQVVSGMGFNPKTQKWYGWSHRAVYGFGIGSTVKKGDCGYTASSVDELFDSVTVPDEDGYAFQKPENVKKLKNSIEITFPMVNTIGSDGSESGPISDFIAEACTEIISPDNKVNYIPTTPAEPVKEIIKVGRGEWVAKTLEDAKQMAADFAEGVS